MIRIFYLGIARGEFYTGGRRPKKAGLPVKLLDDRPEFPGGYMEITYALLPEYAGKHFFTGGGRKWKPKIKQRILLNTLENVKQMQEYREIVIDPDLSRIFRAEQDRSEDAESLPQIQELPRELVAAHLHSKEPFERVCVVFSEDGGTFEAREAILLLSSYLRKIRQVLMIGEDGVATELFSDYLYYEYGLVPDRCEKLSQSLRAWEANKKMLGVAEKIVCLDLGGGSITAEEYMGVLNESWCINPRETLKFLDTKIKNGYNTES